MSVTLSPDDLRALGFDPVASAKIGRAVRFTPGAPTKALRQPKPWAPYASKWEMQYAAYLDLRKTVGQVKDWQYEPDTLVCAGGTKYTPDFRVTYPDDAREYHEVKGFWRTQDKVRMREAAVVSPLPIVLVSRRAGAWTLKTIYEALVLL